jgi:hypothetical protein
MDDLTSRKKEVYRAYDEAALRILMDRYGEEQGEKLLEELRALPEGETSVPAGEDRAVGDALALCAGRKRAAKRRRSALRVCGKIAAVLLVLGSLAGYASFTAAANHEKQAGLTESGYAPPSAQRAKDGERIPDGPEGEEQGDEVQKTAD